MAGAAGLLVLAGAGVDVAQRASSPETTVRRYFAALEAADVDAALDALAPGERGRWTGFIENSLLNEYRVAGIAVRQPSALERIAGDARGPYEATIFLDITQAVDGVRWQATPRVPLVVIEGRWHLSRPPLAD